MMTSILEPFGYNIHFKCIGHFFLSHIACKFVGIQMSINFPYLIPKLRFSHSATLSCMSTAKIAAYLIDGFPVLVS
jgi:hypothetical protein